MKTMALLSALGFVLAACLFAMPAQAQLGHTWVASFGSDGANCDRATPCATFLGAYNKTNAGGEILCADSGNFGGLNITHAITINCEGALGGNSAGMGFGSFTVNVGAADVVTLRGLDFDGLGAGTVAHLINFAGNGTLHLHKVKISHLVGSASGIRVGPAGTVKLFISDCYIADNGGGPGSAGIRIDPIGGTAAVRAVIERTVIANNNLGIVIDATDGGQRTVVEINDSVIAGSAGNGISVFNAGVVINNTSVQGNAGNGILAGVSALIHIGRSTVAGNTLAGLAYNGGQILSYQNNQTKGNGIDNGPSGVLTLN